VRQGERVQSAFNKAVGKTFGENADSLTPEVMEGARKRIGSNLERVWENNSLRIDGDYINKLREIQNQAISKLNPEQAGQVDRLIQSLLGKVDEAGKIPGGFANNWQSELRMVAESEKGLHQKLLSDLRKATLDAFKRSVPEDQAALLSKSLKEYKAFKTVSPLMDKAAAGTAGRTTGDVPATLLPEAVRGSYGSGLADSPFGDLSQIGSQFVADRVARTGGSARAAVQNSVLGSMLTLGAMSNPAALLAVPTAAGTQGLLTSPTLGRALLSGQQSASRGLLAPYLYRSAPVLAVDQ
jgi:hypothetical protein